MARLSFKHSTRYGLAVVSATAVTAVAVFEAWPNDKGTDSSRARSGQRSAPTPVNNVAQNRRVCLLADGQSAAQEIWSALQTLAAESTVNAQRTIQPSGSVGDTSYINDLIRQRCSLIFAVGDNSVSAAATVASTNKDVVFVMAGVNSPAAANIVHLDTGRNISDTVRQLVLGDHG